MGAGLEAGTLLARRYRIQRPLGQGGLAATYLVDDLVFGRPVALKLLALGPESLSILRNEFSLLSGIFHPNLCVAHDFGSDLARGAHFYTAEHIDGTPLDAFCRQFGFEAARRALADGLRALGCLHALGILHGDFKPDNVIVDRTGRGVLIDLSCARPLGPNAPVSVSGTPAFVAPELLAGRNGDERSDLFGVGVTLGRLLEIAPGDAKASAVAKRLTAFEPDERPSDLAEVLEALGDSRPELAPPAGRAMRLIGRERELARFQGLFEDLMRDRAGPRVLHFFGPAGIGRSRLLREIKWSAELRAVVVEGSSGVPRPIASWLGRALTDEPLSSDLAGVLEARDLLDSLGESLVLVFDDVDRLSAQERTLFDAFVRVLTNDDRVMVVCSSVEPLATQSASTRSIELLPLGRNQIAEWATDRVAPRMLAAIEDWSGGRPAYIEAALARLAAGGELDVESEADELSKSTHAELSRLSASERRALAMLAATASDIDATDAERLGVDESTAFSLQRCGFTRAEGASLRLARSAEAPVILATLGSAELGDVHRRIAALLGEKLARSDSASTESSALSGRLVRHLASAGELDAARRVLAKSKPLIDRAPEAWRQTADALAAQAADPELSLIAAEILERSGNPKRALTVLARLLRTKPPEAVRRRIEERAGAAYLRLSNAKRAISMLARAAKGEFGRERRAELWSSTARALILLGDYRAAFERATEASKLATARELVAEIHESLGVSATYLGDTANARTHLDRATALQTGADNPRSRVRLASYRALLDFRGGDAAAAARAYAEALEVAETHGLNDQVVTAHLNLGTACQLDGNWGRALHHYEAGLRAAVALGKASTEITLRFNLSNLFASVGLFDRATAALEETALRARALGLDHLDPHLLALRGEIDLEERRFASADEAFRAAREVYQKREALREVAEMELRLAETKIGAGELDSADRHLRLAERVLKSLDARDVEAQRRLIELQLLLARGDIGRARALLSELDRDDHAGSTSTSFELHRLGAELSTRQGEPDQANARRDQARAALERTAQSLPRPMQIAFWSHPRRKAFAHPSSPEPTRRPSRQPQHSLARFFEINQRLNSTLSTERVLETAIDAAIELTRAERGFVLLASETREKLEVPVARNLDREKIGKSHLKFSRSIAKEVIFSNQAIVTTRADDDERFRDNASVHAMRLKSVACVPIRSLSGVLGALYLDNRFEENRFDAADTELLQAFADQVAIALNNARMVAALERRTAELEAEKRRVDELLLEQASAISRLEHEVQERQEVLEFRYDYSQIVGRSPPMRAIFRKLDRLVASPVNVLVRGESGTGKELVARAIHFNGPRRDKPLLTVNCAALPEALLESELFGHVRGAFTGAERNRDGLFVAARGGAVFLDEVGEMSLPMQAKLLRVLQEREVRPLGSDQVTRVDFRLISATNRSLKDEVEARRFREDLYYRLAVVELELPPLRERPEDIPEIARTVLARLANEWNRPVPALDRDAVRRVMRYAWPGNVRQLENVLAKAMLSADGDRISVADLELPEADPPTRNRRHFSETEADRIRQMLHATRWNVSEVSRTLGIPRNTLYRKMRRYQIEIERGAD